VDGDGRRRPLCLVPIDRLGEKVAVPVAREDLGEHGRRQPSWFRQTLALALHRAFRLELLEQMLQGDLIRALELKRSRDLALADLRR
jgi:hypothetical protein